MKISTIPQIYRHGNRWVEIISVLSKYGLANWISWIDLDFAKDLLKNKEGDALARQRHETRIRLALTELGPTFIKLGQILSTRPDLVGVELAEELQHLQAELPADPPESVRARLEGELGRTIEDLFSEFDMQAMASASIGQVHRARLHSGEDVVVKVMHPGVEHKVRVDLEILLGISQRAERIREFRNYRPRATVAEFQRVLERELDFSRERRNMEQFAHDFADDPTVHIPQVYPSLSTNRVLTMEYLDGIRLSEKAKIETAGIDPVEVARRGAELYLTLIFTHGFYHADPHPGNMLLLSENVIGLVDFGMVGRLDDRLREDIEEMMGAIVGRDASHLTNIITRLGDTPPELDRAALSLDVADFVAHYANVPLDEFNLSAALNEMVEMIRRYEITLPARVAMLLKVLVMLEGTAQLLSPDFSLMEVMRPYQRRMALRRASPVYQLRRLRRMLSEMEYLAERLPRGILDIMQQVQSGRFDIHLDHRGLDPSVNRLVFGMITSALFLGSSLLLSRDVPPLIPWPPMFEGLSVLGMLGCVVSIGLGMRLLLAIRRSGHLDQRR